MLNIILFVFTTLFVSFSVAFPTLRIIYQPKTSQINSSTPDAAHIKYGIEDGRIVRISNVYHMVTAEMVNDPEVVNMSLGAWESKDGWTWKRIQTLRSGSSNFDGTDPRSSVWGPMYIYDADIEKWALLYVTYRGAPSNSSGWYQNFDGEIWLAYSTIPGDEGIHGPFEGDSVILKNPLPYNQWTTWQGLQGTDSMFTWQLPNKTWVALCGSSHTEIPDLFDQKWLIGYAVSQSGLKGPWIRYPIDQPELVNITFGFTENPIVSPMPGSQPGFIVFFDYLTKEDHGFGFGWSPDGVNWPPASLIPTIGGARTPLGILFMTSEEIVNNRQVIMNAGVTNEEMMVFIQNAEKEEKGIPMLHGTGLYWVFYTVFENKWESLRTVIGVIEW